MDSNDEPEEALDEELLYSVDFDTTCTICQAEFLDPEDLAIHVVQIHKITETLASKVKPCDFCTSMNTSLMDYAVHFRDNHILKLKYCQFCLRAFTDREKHRLHEKKHKKSSNNITTFLYSCVHCSDTFRNFSELQSHDFKKHKDVLEGVLIHELLPHLSGVLNIKAPSFLLSLNSENGYMCVSCNYSTADVSHFIEHAQTSECKPFVCENCCNVYKKKKNMLRHISKGCNTVSVSGKTHECPDCSQVFPRYKFYQHKKQCKAIKCYTCDIVFSTIYELSEHQSKEHPSSVELKSCTYCGKECVGSITMQKHIERSHKPELHLYKYTCLMCKTAYKHPQKLFGHYFSKHKDLEPYTCKICDKKFKMRKKFTLHIKLDHNSVGFVEFDENYHVFFAEKKSENPFIPKSLYADQIADQRKTVETPDNSNELGILNSEMSVTETEGNQTEVESTPKPKLKRKRALRVPKQETHETIDLESSDDEPLLVIKKRVQKSMPKILRNRWRKKHMTSVNKKRFTCNICKKYCYTFQNYNHHISLHSNKDYKKCIKCSQVFKSKEKLNKHIATEHSTSKLTETLKTLLEKRKKGQKITDDLPNSEKFRRTIKKVQVDNIQSTATITSIDNKLSVQKFIENFTPEGEAKTETPLITNSVSIKVIRGCCKQPTIKMTKFDPKPLSNSLKLSMPVKFKDCYQEKCSARIKLVPPTPVFEDDTDYNDYVDTASPEMDRYESIPEVAEEVMLEGTEETPKVVQIPHKIVIPKLPAEYKDIRIAHLLPEAPYYKIVKVNEVLRMQENLENGDLNNTKSKNDQTNTNSPKSKVIKLPDGTKLVNTNPLAHLLGKQSVEKVLQPLKSKYYKPKEKNLQGMLASALTNFNKPVLPKKRKKKTENISNTKVESSNGKSESSIGKAESSNGKVEISNAEVESSNAEVEIEIDEEPSNFEEISNIKGASMPEIDKD